MTANELKRILTDTFPALRPAYAAGVVSFSVPESLLYDTEIDHSIYLPYAQTQTRLAIPEIADVR